MGPGSTKTPSSWSSTSPPSQRVIVLLVLAAIQAIPLVVLGFYVALSLIAFAMYWRDKVAARHGQWRGRGPELRTTRAHSGGIGPSTRLASALSGPAPAARYHEGQWWTG
jgi:hypothetical protein